MFLHRTNRSKQSIHVINVIIWCILHCKGLSIILLQFLSAQKWKEEKTDEEHQCFRKFFANANGSFKKISKKRVKKTKVLKRTENKFTAKEMRVYIARCRYANYISHSTDNGDSSLYFSRLFFSPFNLNHKPSFIHFIRINVFSFGICVLQMKVTLFQLYKLHF